MTPGRVDETITIPVARPAHWPAPPKPAAFYGLAGDIARASAPHTEADPIAVLARTDEEVHARLRAITNTASEALTSLWQSTREAAQSAEQKLRQIREHAEDALPPEKFCVLIECNNEDEQVALLRRFKAQGLKCKAIIA